MSQRKSRKQNSGQHCHLPTNYSIHLRHYLKHFHLNILSVQNQVTASQKESHCYRVNYPLIFLEHNQEHLLSIHRSPHLVYLLDFLQAKL